MSLNTVVNGKGDAPRHDPVKYRAGFDEINWRKKCSIRCTHRTNGGLVITTCDLDEGHTGPCTIATQEVPRGGGYRRA